VQTGAPGTFVYLINANNTVSVKTIKAGPVDGQFQAVTSGLEPGDRVVTDGTDRLRDGAQVTLPAAKNGQQASGQKGGTGETPAAGAPASDEGEKGKGERHRHRESSTPSAE
jgi:membrane fusion protein, multidrug efflux system